MIRIQITYIDDYSVKHICIVNTFADFNFLKDRFNVIEYEVVA